MTGQDELTVILARAFDRAWNLYYAPWRDKPIAEGMARRALARHLVVIAREGAVDEDALITAGLHHLHMLAANGDDVGERPDWTNVRFRIDGVRARFAREWRVRVSQSAR